LAGGGLGRISKNGRIPDLPKPEPESGTTLVDTGLRRIDEQLPIDPAAVAQSIKPSRRFSNTLLATRNCLISSACKAHKSICICVSTSRIPNYLSNTYDVAVAMSRAVSETTWMFFISAAEGVIDRGIRGPSGSLNLPGHF